MTEKQLTDLLYNLDLESKELQLQRENLYSQLDKIESVADNSYRTDCKIMAIVRNYDCISKKISDDISRADFFNVTDLELAIQKGKAEVEYRRANKDKYQRRDETEQVTNLLTQLFKETKWQKKN